MEYVMMDSGLSLQVTMLDGTMVNTVNMDKRSTDGVLRGMAGYQRVLRSCFGIRTNVRMVGPVENACNYLNGHSFGGSADSYFEQFKNT